MLGWVMMSVKITCNLSTGDKEKAEKMARNLVMNTPGLGHTVAGVVKVCGDDKLAEKLLKEANSNMSTMTNSIPVVGHAKGLIHYACDDKEAGHEAMASATRSTAVLAAGATGFVVAGPVGAVIARTQVGLAWDTGVHILSDGETKSGVYQIESNLCDPWNYVDAAASVLSDGVGCYSPGKTADRKIKNSLNSAKAKEYLDDIEDDEMVYTKMDYRNSDTGSKICLTDLTF